MKKNCKRFFALLLAAIMVFSVASTVMADEETNEVVLMSSEGLGDANATYGTNASRYPTDSYLYPAWDAESSAYGGKSTGMFSDAQNIANINVKSTTFLNSATDLASGVTPLDNERYRILPLLKTGTATPNKDNKKYFSALVDDFENATISVDMVKNAYDNLKSKNPNVQFKIGLANVYYDGGSKTYKRSNNSTQYVYPADIAWIDITDDVAGLKNYTKSVSYKDGITQKTYSVSDIINNGVHKRINGAVQGDAKYDLTAENANALVFGIILDDATYFSTDNILFVNNIKIIPAVEEPEPDTTVITDNRKKADFLLWSRLGASASTHYNSDTYSDKNVYAYHSWNPMSSLNGSTSANIFTQQDTLATLTLTKTPIGNATAFNGASEVDVERYRILPLAKPGGTVNIIQTSVIEDYNDDIINFENGYLKVDMIKGGSFPDISADDDNQYKAFKIGLAYVDYSTKASYTSESERTVYATDIAWLDITKQIEALNEFPENYSAIDWNDVKKEVSVSVSDIITNGTHKYINGATPETHTLTAKNANAVVFGIELENNVYPSGTMLYFDNLRISMPVPPTSVSFDEESSIDDGVILNIANGESRDITPTVVVAYYLSDILVDVKIDTSFTAEAGYIGEKSIKYPIDGNIETDRVVVMALDSLTTLRPLCAKFEEKK